MLHLAYISSYISVNSDSVSWHGIQHVCRMPHSPCSLAQQSAYCAIYCQQAV